MKPIKFITMVMATTMLWSTSLQIAQAKDTHQTQTTKQARTKKQVKAKKSKTKTVKDKLKVNKSQSTTMKKHLKVISTGGSDLLHLKIKPQDRRWATDPSLLNPEMAWEVDNTNHPLTAPTYGDHHNIVYYRIVDTGSFGSQIQSAINNWNQLGVISLQPAPDDTVTAMNISANDPNQSNRTNAGGVTDYEFDDQTHQFTKINVYLEPGLVDNTDQYKINTIEHEIGHALGFAHDKSISYDPSTLTPIDFASSVMHSEDDNQSGTYQSVTFPLGTREANNLKQHYQVNP